MDFTGAARPMTLNGLRMAANLIRCDAAAILAVLDVETSSCGFLSNKKPQMLFERHIFHRETNGQFDTTAPDISAAYLGGYGFPGIPQYERLRRAMELDERAALRSASWGIAQIMGFNAEFIGYDSAAEMVAEFCDDEDAQLIAMAKYCVARGLGDELRHENWDGFAYGFNGPRHWQNNYAERLEKAYERHVNGPPIDMNVRAAQVRLMFAGLYLARIDGIWGRQTEAALVAAGHKGLDVGYKLVS